nr:hypothetical protein [uncultured Flavobacterium sp.]
MNLKLIYLIILCTTVTVSQEDKTIFYCNQEIDTLPYFKENAERDNFYEIKHLELLNHNYMFRSWDGNACIEIIKNRTQLSGKIYFAVSDRQKKRFSKNYNLSEEEVQNLLSLIKKYHFFRRKHPSGFIPVVHTFEIKNKSEIEIYTTDSPQFSYRISDIIPIYIYFKKFEKEIPFQEYTYFELIKAAENEEPYYLSKRNE